MGPKRSRKISSGERTGYFSGVVVSFRQFIPLSDKNLTVSLDFFPKKFKLEISGIQRKRLKAFLHKTRKIERFSVECRKTKTKVITTASQNKGQFQKEPMITESKHR